MPCDDELAAEGEVYVFPSEEGEEFVSSAKVEDISSHATCSLAPGRTAPCTATSDSGLVVFPNPKQDKSHRTCSLGPGRTVPCNVVSDAEVFEFGD